MWQRMSRLRVRTEYDGGADLGLCHQSGLDRGNFEIARSKVSLARRDVVILSDFPAFDCIFDSTISATAGMLTCL